MAKYKPYDTTQKICDCGCGKKFTPKRTFQKYINTDHANRHWNISHPRIKKEVGEK